MKVNYLPENGKNFIPFEVDGNTIEFNDDELSFRVDKKERDYEVVLDICKDYTGGLVMGAASGKSYVAQLTIPAREYTETDNGDEEGTIQEPVPFDIDRCTLDLWEMEA